MKYIVCFSGGHSSALAAIETVRKYGKENVILLNHDISSKVEHQDIKRFKRDVADYLDLDITYANMEGWEKKTPCQVCIESGAFQVNDNHQALCTTRIKTEPFFKYLAEKHPATFENPNVEIKIIYGFDKDEKDRIQRRSSILATKGYATDYPLAFDERTIESTEELGINRPVTYKIYKHANCRGCLKSGMQHWYLTYCLDPEIWEEGKQAENKIGYSIIKWHYLEELEPKFKQMRCMGIVPSEKGNAAGFWAAVNREIPGQMGILPCECAI